MPQLHKQTKKKSTDIVDSVTRKYSSAVSSNTLKLKTDSKKGEIFYDIWDSKILSYLRLNINVIDYD